MHQRNNKLLLAVDCLDSQLRNPAHAFATALLLSKKLGLSMDVVSVISPDQLGWPSEFTSPWKEEFKNLGANALQQYLKRMVGSKKVDSKAILQPFHSRKQSVRTIADEAKKIHAAAIAVFTHGNKKPMLTMPGGFVSSLIHNSQVPVVAINARVQPLKKIDSILFATDFSKEGARSLTQVISVAKKLKAKLHILHVLPTLFDASLVASSGIVAGWDNVEIFIEEEEKVAQKKGERSLNLAKKQGLAATYEILRTTKSISGCILDVARKNKVDLLVVTEKTGPFASVVLGSVSREILRGATQPVWVMPSR